MYLKPIDATTLMEFRHLLEANDLTQAMLVEVNAMLTMRSNRRVEIPFVRVGRRVMYRQSDLDTFINANVHDTSLSIATEVPQRR